MPKIGRIVEGVTVAAKNLADKLRKSSPGMDYVVGGSSSP